MSSLDGRVADRSQVRPNTTARITAEAVDVASPARLLLMADEGMSEGEAQALAVVVKGATEDGVEVRAEDAYFVVGVLRAVPGDSFTLRDEQDWQWLGPRIRDAE